MTVLVLRTVRPSLRGELSRWMVEFQAGVFVGNLPGRVRDRLWEKIVQKETRGSAIMIHSARTEQGYLVHCHGEPSRQPVDMDGITLMKFLGVRPQNPEP